MSRPKSKMLNLPASVAKRGIGAYAYLNSFLDSRDLCAVAQTCRVNRDLNKRNCRASELLFYGVNSTKDRKKKLLELLADQKSSQEAQSIVLTRVNGRQVFARPNFSYYCFSRNRGPIAVIRTLANLSPLEATVLCGDFHFVQLLLDNLKGLHHNQEANQQLKKIREKLESDPRSCISLIISLQRAYKEYTKNKAILVDPKDFDELDYLSGLIGEQQKNLPWFILQILCRAVPLEPLPDFSKEPERECLYVNGSAFDWDAIGRFARFAIFSGRGGARPAYGHYGLFDDAALDSAALGKLCTVIKSELDRIIKLHDQKLMLAAYPNPERSPLNSSPPGGLSLNP